MTFGQCMFAFVVIFICVYLLVDRICSSINEFMSIKAFKTYLEIAGIDEEDAKDAQKIAEKYKEELQKIDE